LRRTRDRRRAAGRGLWLLLLAEQPADARNGRCDGRRCVGRAVGDVLHGAVLARDARERASRTSGTAATRDCHLTRRGTRGAILQAFPYQGELTAKRVLIALERVDLVDGEIELEREAEDLRVSLQEQLEPRIAVATGSNLELGIELLPVHIPHAA
jgi:hypothetical protein